MLCLITPMLPGIFYKLICNISCLVNFLFYYHPILEDFRPSVCSDFVTLRVPSLDSATGWTGELWSNTNFSIVKTKRNVVVLFFWQKKKDIKNFQIFLKKNICFFGFFRFSDLFLFFSQTFWMFFRFLWTYLFNFLDFLDF